jgi:uncharacterized protein YeeX (DUF496 family)
MINLILGLVAVEWDGNQRAMFNFLTNYEKTEELITSEEETFRIDFCNGECQLGDLIIKNMQGEEKAHIGDYIIKDTNGEFHVVTPEVFKRFKEVKIDANRN